MRTRGGVLLCGLLGVGAGAALPHALTAQQFPGFGGLEGRAGLYVASKADPGFGFSVDLGLGSLGSPVLRTLVGFNYFSADVDREDDLGQPVGGSYSAVGGRVGLRLDPFGAGRFTPYFSATITGHNVSADVDVPAVQSLLEGFYVGAGLGAGLTYSFDAEERYALTVDGRRVFANNVGHWAAEVGLRITPLGRAAYVARFRPVPVFAPPAFEDEAARLRAERERLEAERLRVERERLEAERLRQQQQQQADTLGRALRQQADTLALAVQREAEARAAAEREAAAARAQAEAAAAQAAAATAQAREAEQRAQAAERQFYEALLNLDRLIANVTEIRETERGLSVVLGQGLFATGQAALSPRARDEVGRIAAVLAQYPERPIVVEGHTDAVGSEVANQRLSERRAEAVRAALIAQGIDPARVTMTGYGESQPIADNETPAGRAQNRRVEILIVGARRPVAS